MACRIIPAELAWAPCLTAIAIAAKAHWRYPASWLYAWREELTLSPNTLRSMPTYVAVCDERIVGFYSIRTASRVASLEHLWVLPIAMGKGIGRMLFQHAMLLSAENGCREILVESDPNAEGFYLRMGARRQGYRESPVQGVTRQLPVLRKDLPMHV